MSWVVGLLINGAICFWLGAALSLTQKIWLKVICFVGMPYFSAYGLYWALAYAEGVSDQHSSWAGLVIAPWTVAGWLVMAIGLGLFSVMRAKRNAGS
jgi:hypothetical protein